MAPVGESLAGIARRKRPGACLCKPCGLGHTGAEPTAPDGSHSLAHARPGDADTSAQTDVDATSFPAHVNALAHGDVPAERHAASVCHDCTQHARARRANGNESSSAHGNVSAYALALSNRGQAHCDTHDSSSTDPHISGPDGYIRPADSHFYGDVGQRDAGNPSFHRYP